LIKNKMLNPLFGDSAFLDFSSFFELREKEER